LADLFYRGSKWEQKGSHAFIVKISSSLIELVLYIWQLLHHKE